MQGYGVHPVQKIIHHGLPDRYNLPYIYLIYYIVIRFFCKGTALRQVKSNHGGTFAPGKNLTTIRTESGGTNGVYHGREKKIAAEFAPRYRKTGKGEKS
jgi:hypothetical protein